MEMIDARAATQNAIERLAANNAGGFFENLKIATLPQFLAEAEKKEKKLSLRDKQLLCDQAIIVLDQFYVHLPFKRARYAVDPVQKLRLLREEAAGYDELGFHAAMIRIFTSLRDAGTLYLLPNPFAGAFVFLPFHIDVYQSKNGKRNFVVTDIVEGFNPDPGNFGRNCEISAWNGVPIDVAVNLVAQTVPGGNDATRTFHGTRRLTLRSINTLPPTEELVFVQYKPFRPDSKPAAERVIAVPWSVASNIGKSKSAAVSQIDLAEARKALWGNNDRIANHKNGPFEVHHTQEQSQTKKPWSNILTDGKPNRKFGYIRIENFAGAFGSLARMFQDILKDLVDSGNASDGLIIDIRSNPGGDLKGAECMLQMLTAKPIEPARFSFPNTEAVQHLLADAASESETTGVGNVFGEKAQSFLQAKQIFGDWVAGVLKGAASGSALTDARPITPVKDANATGQIYQGPVTLLTDAGVQGAASIFAGGFQDHKIGPIIGTDENTGGGGAASWHHGYELMKLRPLIDRPIRALPNGISIRFATQRVSRVAGFEGNPVEDLGVKSDIRYKKTLADLGPVSEDLLRFACKTLAKIPRYTLSIEKAGIAANMLTLRLNTSRNLDRIIFLFDRDPAYFFSSGPEKRFKKDWALGLSATPLEVEVQGYIWKTFPGGKQYELVAKDSLIIKKKPGSSPAAGTT